MQQTVRIVNRRGLHARASAKFVKVASRFDARISVTKDGTTVSGTSIMGLMMLAASPDQVLDIEATGRQARAALKALNALISNRFDED